MPEIDVSKDDFNEAKQSFDIDRSDSNSSIRYKYWISRCLFINRIFFRSSSGNSQLNHAVVDLSRSSLPKIDRGMKQDAVIKYSGVTGDKLDVLDNMEDVLKTQSDIANKSLAREKEKLDLENK